MREISDISFHLLEVIFIYKESNLVSYVYPEYVVCGTSYGKLHLANIKLVNNLFLRTLRNQIIGNPNKKVFTVTLHIIRIKPFPLYGQ